MRIVSAHSCPWLRAGMAFTALLWANACLPTTDLSSYTDGPGLPSSGGSSGDGGSGGTPPEVVPGPIQNQPDAAAPANGGSAPVEDAAVVTDSGAVAQPCTGNGEFPSPNGVSCYSVFPAVVAWQAAQAACQEWGGTLVIIQSNAEDQFLQQNIIMQDSWIGASDTALENTFVWVNGDPVQFENWGAAQPDNFDDGEDCVEKRFIGGLWNDVPCTSMVEKAALCER
jgi:hypothetical protein